MAQDKSFGHCNQHYHTTTGIFLPGLLHKLRVYTGSLSETESTTVNKIIYNYNFLCENENLLYPLVAKETD